MEKFPNTCGYNLYFLLWESSRKFGLMRGGRRMGFMESCKTSSEKVFYGLYADCLIQKFATCYNGINRVMKGLKKQLFTFMLLQQKQNSFFMHTTSFSFRYIVHLMNLNTYVLISSTINDMRHCIKSIIEA